MEIQRVSVLGSGTMGSAISQVIATGGYEVAMVGRRKESMDQALQSINESLDRFVRKETLSSAEKEGIIRRIRPTTDIEEVSATDLIIEAMPEQLDIKLEIFGKLDSLCREGAILGSSTSSIPITVIAASTRRPERVIGIHFMNPAPIMKGVELIRGRLTGDDTVKTCIDFTRRLDKHPVVALDYAGFITSRLLTAYLNEAALSVSSGNAPQDVDEAMVFCMNMPMGPCALMDLVGIDTVVHVLAILEEEFGERFKASPLLKQMARAGHLGKKTGIGFFKYSEDGKKEPVPLFPRIGGDRET